MQDRLVVYTHSSKSWLNSKFNCYTYTRILPLQVLVLSAGLYKPAAMAPQHALIFSLISGKPAVVNHQIHGKRQRRTTSLDAKLINNTLYAVINKFVH